jgi:two-component system chemotaxis response regulator CheB
VLTGNLDDGTVGLQSIKAYGGIAIAQDPAEAEVPSMPLSAMEYVDIDYCLPLDEIAATLVSLVKTPLAREPQPGKPGLAAIENRFTLEEDPGMAELEKIGKPSEFTCPECHGSLWEIEGVVPQRFRCHTGHAFTARTLQSAQDQLVEEAVWAAVRALHEKQALHKRFAKTAAESMRMEAAAEHEATASQASRHAKTLRKLISG